MAIEIVPPEKEQPEKKRRERELPEYVGEPLYPIQPWRKAKGLSNSSLYKLIGMGKIKVSKLPGIDSSFISKSEDERICREAEAIGNAEVAALGKKKKEGKKKAQAEEEANKNVERAKRRVPKVKG